MRLVSCFLQYNIKKPYNACMSDFLLWKIWLQTQTKSFSSFVLLYDLQTGFYEKDYYFFNFKPYSPLQLGKTKNENVMLQQLIPDFNSTV